VDLDLQIAAEQAIEGKNGAIVAMDPHTGEILAMVSRPTFDPNDLREGLAERVEQADPRSRQAAADKAIQAQLAPGSTFKIIMATAGWQKGLPRTLHVNCSGGATFYGPAFWLLGEKRPRRSRSAEAIYQSCDVFFYTLAEKLGIDRIAKWATAFGLGQKTASICPTK